jgi:cation transport ATPase
MREQIEMATVARQNHSETRTVEFAVTGMTCAACAARVKRQLGRLDGVIAEVNLATERATVSIPRTVATGDVIAAVRKAGYGATVLATDRPAPSTDARDRVRDLWRRLVVALLLGVPLADLSV